MHFPVGIDDYRKLRERDCVFVDKTDMIKTFIDDRVETQLVCRPRRFGKTLNMSMLSTFFCLQNAKQNRALFADTEIATLKTLGGQDCMDFQGQYPVVYLSLKDFRSAKDYPGFFARLSNKLSILFESYDYLLTKKSSLKPGIQAKLNKIIQGDASEALLIDALFLLTMALHEFHHKPVMVFLDEYDAPMQAAFMAETPFENEVTQFMADFLGRVFKTNPHLARGLLTGIAQTALMNLFSGMNNVPVVTFLSSEYATYFGFSRSEVTALIEQAGLPKNALSMIEDWYNGYGSDEQQIYNPWSVMNCLAKGVQFDSYWNDSGEHGVIGRSLISSKDTQTLAEFSQLVAGGEIEANYLPGLVWNDITHSRSALWNLLLTTGYLKITADSGPGTLGERKISLKIPNNEVMRVFVRIISNWGQVPGGGGSVYEEVAACLKTGDIETFCNALEEYLLQTASYYDFGRHTSEKFYHVFLLGLMFTLQADFFVESNRETGSGRPDIVLVPRDQEKYPTGILFELKSIQGSSCQDESILSQAFASAHAAVKKQIASKHYPSALKRHGVTKALHVSMIFHGKAVNVSCESVEY